MSRERRSGVDRRRRDIGPPRGMTGRREGDRQADEAVGPAAMGASTLLDLARRAIQLYVEAHPRPNQVTQDQVAEMVGVSRATVSRMIKAGQLKLNKFGKVPISEVDRALKAN